MTHWRCGATRVVTRVVTRVCSCETHARGQRVVLRILGMSKATGHDESRVQQF
jgi:hypothetical protein